MLRAGNARSKFAVEVRQSDTTFGSTICWLLSPPIHHHDPAVARSVWSQWLAWKAVTVSLPFPQHALPHTTLRQPPIAVAIANDYPLVIAGTAAALQQFPAEITVVEYASRTKVKHPVDVVLFDTFGVAPGSADVRTGLLQDLPTLVLVFTWQTAPARVKAALRAGAAGVVSKTVTPEALVDAVRRVHGGEQVIPIAQPLHLSDTGFGRWPGDRSGLSARESEVLALFCQGLSHHAVGQSMYLSKNTIKTYVRSLYRKIGATTRPQAVIWGLSNGFRAEPARIYPRND